MERLLEAKKKMNVSYTTMAEILKVDRAVLSNILHGKRYVSLEYFKPICKYLGFNSQEATEIWKQLKIKRLQKRIDDIENNG
jgi:plasmid maintenance system antidote protein VapI